MVKLRVNFFQHYIMKAHFALSLQCMLFLSVLTLRAKGDTTTINFYFQGMIPGSSEASPTPVSLWEAHDTPPLKFTEQPEVINTYSTDHHPDDVKPEVLPLIGVSEEGRGLKLREDFNGCRPPIKYYGGPVMTGTNYVYIIYYGSYSTFSSASSSATTLMSKSLFETFTKGLSGTDWWKINTEYYMETNSGRKFVAPTFQFGGTYSVNPPYKSATWDSKNSIYKVSHANLQQLILDTVGRNVIDNAVYLVIPSPDVCMYSKNRSNPSPFVPDVDN